MYTILESVLEFSSSSLPSFLQASTDTHCKSYLQEAHGVRKVMDLQPSLLCEIHPTIQLCLMLRDSAEKGLVRRLQGKWEKGMGGLNSVGLK